MIAEIGLGPESDGSPSPIFEDRLENNSISSLDMSRIEFNQFFIDILSSPNLWVLKIIPLSWKKQLAQELYIFLRQNQSMAIEVVGNWSALIQQEELAEEEGQVTFLEVVDTAIRLMHPIRRQNLLARFAKQIS